MQENQSKASSFFLFACNFFRFFLVEITSENEDEWIEDREKGHPKQFHYVNGFQFKMKLDQILITKNQLIDMGHGARERKGKSECEFALIWHCACNLNRYSIRNCVKGFFVHVVLHLKMTSASSSSFSSFKCNSKEANLILSKRFSLSLFLSLNGKVKTRDRK